MWELSHLPVEDFESGLKHLEQKYEFQDKRYSISKFICVNILQPIDFIEYIHQKL